LVVCPAYWHIDQQRFLNIRRHDVPLSVVVPELVPPSEATKPTHVPAAHIPDVDMSACDVPER
jgi:hypothetical protein